MNTSEPSDTTKPDVQASGIDPSSFPMAKIQNSTAVSARFRSRLWWLTLVCGLISLSLFWYTKQSDHDRIVIEFQETYGLKLEDRLKYHGVEIGSVQKIELNKDRSTVLIHVRMTADTRSMACESARFWIVRPLVSLDSIQGLDTILGAKYIAIEPGPSDSKIAKQFRGLDTPPIPTPPDGSLEITLDGNTRGGLESNAPILYRGFRIGTILQVGFASDARTVQARCAIDPEFRDLVRQNSKFWNRSGWRLDIGLSGIHLDADTFAQILSGGVEMATPTEPDRGVSTGHRFKLYDKPEAEWSLWQPSLAHGQAWDRLSLTMPQPIRMALRWQERSFGFRNNQQRIGWCLPLDDGIVICINELVQVPSSALPDSVRFEFAGLSLPADKITIAAGPIASGKTSHGPARFSMTDSFPPNIILWPIRLVAKMIPDQVCDVLIAHPDASSVLAIDSARLSVQQSGWSIDDMVTIDRDYHGAPVVSVETAQVIGWLTIETGQRLIIGL